MKKKMFLIFTLALLLVIAPMVVMATDEVVHECGDECQIPIIHEVAGLINALPDAENITLDNVNSVIDKLHAIDDIKYEIGEDDNGNGNSDYYEMLALLNGEYSDEDPEPTRYANAIAAVEQYTDYISFVVQKQYLFASNTELNMDTAWAEFTVKDAATGEVVDTFTVKQVDGSSLSNLGLYSECFDEDGNYTGWAYRYYLPAGTYTVEETAYSAEYIDGSDFEAKAVAVSTNGVSGVSEFTISENSGASVMFTNVDAADVAISIVDEEGTAITDATVTLAATEAGSFEFNNGDQQSLSFYAYTVSVSGSYEIVSVAIDETHGNYNTETNTLNFTADSSVTTIPVTITLKAVPDVTVSVTWPDAADYTDISISYQLMDGNDEVMANGTLDSTTTTVFHELFDVPATFEFTDVPEGYIASYVYDGNNIEYSVTLTEIVNAPIMVLDEEGNVLTDTKSYIKITDWETDKVELSFNTADNGVQLPEITDASWARYVEFCGFDRYQLQPLSLSVGEDGKLVDEYEVLQYNEDEGYYYVKLQPLQMKLVIPTALKWELVQTDNVYGETKNESYIDEETGEKVVTGTYTEAYVYTVASADGAGNVTAGEDPHGVTFEVADDGAGNSVIVFSSVGAVNNGEQYENGEVIKTEEYEDGSYNTLALYSYSYEVIVDEDSWNAYTATLEQKEGAHYVYPHIDFDMDVRGVFGGREEGFSFRMSDANTPSAAVALADANADIATIEIEPEWGKDVTISVEAGAELPFDTVTLELWRYPVETLDENDNDIFQDPSACYVSFDMGVGSSEMVTVPLTIDAYYTEEYSPNGGVAEVDAYYELHLNEEQATALTDAGYVYEITGDIDNGFVFSSDDGDDTPKYVITTTYWDENGNEVNDDNPLLPEYATIDIELQNITNAIMGTIGLYLDPQVFDMRGFDKSYIELADGLDYVPAFYEIDGAMTDVNVQVGPIATDADAYFSSGAFNKAGGLHSDSYVAFTWHVDENAENANEAVNGKIATITVPMAFVGLAEELKDLKQYLGDKTVYGIDYATTPHGEYIKTLPEDVADYNMAMAGWHDLNYTDYDNIGGLPIDNTALAVRNGFYQVYSNEYADAALPMDVALEFVQPEWNQNIRVEFYVTVRVPEIAGGTIGTPGVDLNGRDKDETLYNDHPLQGAEIRLIYTGGNNIGYSDRAGYAPVNLTGFNEDGIYKFEVKHAQAWRYASGMPGSNSGTYTYAKFKLNDDGSVTMQGVEDNSYWEDDAGSEKTTTPLTEGGAINPQLMLVTWHEDGLAKHDNNAHVTLSATTPECVSDYYTFSNGKYQMFNGVDYTFTLTLDEGYEWNIGTGEGQYANMAAIAEAITMTTYSAVAADELFERVDPTTMSFQEEPLFSDAAGLVAYDAATQTFTVEGENIIGDPAYNYGYCAAMGSSGGTGVNYMNTRAGDVLFTLPDDAVVAKSFTVTATAGEGGTVSYTDDDTSNSTFVTSDDDKTITETFEYGGSVVDSATYTFTAEEGNTIASVVINGVEQAIVEGLETYEYQFTGIMADQTIYVTFANAETPIVNGPQLTVISGEGGQTAVATDVDGVGGTVINGQEVFLLPASDAAQTFALTITPEAYYVVASIVVDGVAEEFTYTDDNDGDDATAGYVELDLERNNDTSSSVVVTFKLKDEAATDATVIAEVIGGKGMVEPAGTNLYAVGYEPTYTVTAETYYQLESVIYDGTDITAQFADDGAYTLPALTAGTHTLQVKFGELEHNVEGIIHIVGGELWGTLDEAKTHLVAPAVLTFTRTVDGYNVADDSTFTIISDDVPVDLVDEYRAIAFEGTLPAGTYDVVVNKAGYLSYTITGFTIALDTKYDIIFGDTDYQGANDPDAEGATPTPEAMPIVMICGDASRDYNFVAYNDASVVTSGWIANAKAANKLKGDLDESGYTATVGEDGTHIDAASAGSNSIDMGFVYQNMYATAISETYAEFCVAE